MSNKPNNKPSNKPSNKIINTVYVVTNSPERYNSIKTRFTPMANKVIRFQPIEEDKLSDEIINNVSTSMCKYMCSPSMISTWLTHTRVWADIVKKGEDRVLILEDSAEPVSTFEGMLQEYWKEIPLDWDMVYFGCQGSCEESSIKDAMYKLLYQKTNSDVYKDNSKMVLVNKPGVPLGLYGYMLSLKGADKLIKCQDLQLVNFNLDQSLASQLDSIKGFKAYALKPALIIKKEPNNKVKNHKILKPFTEDIKLSEHQSIDDVSGYTVYYIRHLGVKISYFAVALFLLSLGIGFFGTDCVHKVYLSVVTFIQLAEIAYTKTDPDKIKMLMFELLIGTYLAVYLGMFIRSKIKSTNKNTPSSYK